MRQIPFRSEKADYQQKPVKDKSNDGDMERDDIAKIIARPDMLPTDT